MTPNLLQQLLVPYQTGGGIYGSSFNATGGGGGLSGVNDSNALSYLATLGGSASQPVTSAFDLMSTTPTVQQSPQSASVSQPLTLSSDSSGVSAATGDEAFNDPAVAGYSFGDMLGSALTFGLGPAGAVAGTIASSAINGKTPNSLTSIFDVLSQQLFGGGSDDVDGFGAPGGSIGAPDPGVSVGGIGGGFGAGPIGEPTSQTGHDPGVGGGGDDFGGGFGDHSDIGAEGIGEADPGGGIFALGGLLDQPQIPMGAPRNIQAHEGEFVMPLEAVLFHGTDKLHRMINQARNPKGRRA